MRRGTRRPGGSPSALLHQRLVAALAGVANWELRSAWPLGHLPALTIEDTDRIRTVIDPVSGNDATAQTDALRPTYSATALDGGPGATFDGSNGLLTAAIDLTSSTGYIIGAVAENGGANQTTLDLGDFSGGPGHGLGTTSLSRWFGYYRGNFRSYARTDTGLGLLHVAVSTADTNLSSEGARIRLDGADATDNWLVDESSFGLVPLSSEKMAIGYSPISSHPGTTGSIAYAFLAVGSNDAAIPTTQLAVIEAELAAAQAVGDYWS